MAKLLSGAVSLVYAELSILQRATAPRAAALVISSLQELNTEDHSLEESIREGVKELRRLSYPNARVACDESFTQTAAFA